MDTEFVNAYIERLVREAAELMKTKMLLETQLSIVSKRYSELLQKTNELENKQSLEPILNKKNSKAKENTF